MDKWPETSLPSKHTQHICISAQLEEELLTHWHTTTVCCFSAITQGGVLNGIGTGVQILTVAEMQVTQTNHSIV
jgi:hypothetical protein